MQTKGTATHTRPEITTAYVTETGRTILAAFEVDTPAGPRTTLATADTRTGKISHFTDWTLAPDLAAAGAIATNRGGPATYGHTDYHLHNHAIRRILEHAPRITFDEYHLIKGAQ